MMKAVGGLTRSLTPGFSRATLTGQYNQLQPRIPEDEDDTRNWDDGAGVEELLQDIEHNDDYGATTTQLIGVDGFPVPQSSAQFSVQDARMRVQQQLRNTRLGVEMDDFSNAASGDFSSGNINASNNGGRGSGASTSEQLRRITQPFGHLEAGLESDLNYPFHFLNTIMRYYDAGLLGAALLLLLMTSLLGAMWVALLEYTPLKDIFIKHDIPGSLSIVNLIIALVYNTLVQQSLSGFEAVPQMYQQTISAVRDLARKFTTATEIPRASVWTRRAAASATAAPGDVNEISLDGTNTDSTTPNENPRTADADAVPADVMQRCLRTYELCKALLQFSFQLYSSSTDCMRPLYSQEVHRLLHKWGMRKNNQRSLLSHFMTFLLDEWGQDVTILKNEGLLEPTDITSLQRAEEQLRECIDRFDGLRQIRAPDIFSNLLRVVMYFYVLFILPVSMYDSVGQYMIISYDIVVMLVFGPVYFKWWLGDPFDSSPRYTGMPFYQWRASEYADICLRQSEMRLKWSIACPQLFTEEQLAELKGGSSALRAMKIATLQGIVQDCE